MPELEARERVVAEVLLGELGELEPDLGQSRRVGLDAEAGAIEIAERGVVAEFGVDAPEPLEGFEVARLELEHLLELGERLAGGADALLGERRRHQRRPDPMRLMLHHVRLTARGEGGGGPVRAHQRQPHQRRKRRQMARAQLERRLQARLGIVGALELHERFRRPDQVDGAGARVHLRGFAQAGEQRADLCLVAVQSRPRHQVAQRRARTRLTLERQAVLAVDLGGDLLGGELGVAPGGAQTRAFEVQGDGEGGRARRQRHLVIEAEQLGESLLGEVMALEGAQGMMVRGIELGDRLAGEQRAGGVAAQLAVDHGQLLVGVHLVPRVWRLLEIRERQIGEL